VKVARLVSADLVAGVEPAAAPGLGGGVCVFQILAHEAAPAIGRVGATQHELTTLANRDVVITLVDDPRLVLRKHPTEAARANSPLALRRAAEVQPNFGHSEHF